MAATRAELLEIAERALAGVRGEEAQATAWWERQLTAGAGRSVVSEALSVEVAVIRDGRVGAAVTTEVDDDDGLAAAAAAAARLAPGGPAAAGGLPEPAPGHDHDGYDPGVESLEPLGALGEWDTWRAAAAKTAIASTRGVRAYEQRSFADLRVRRQGEPGRSLELAATAVGPAGLDPAGLADEALALLGGGEPSTVEAGEQAVVLGPWAMAEVVRRAGLAFGGPQSAMADRLGTRVAAPAVNLSDSPRFAATLPRSYDAEGAPRQPLPLVQDGVAHRVVAAGTGHAVGPGGVGGTVPDHLVLVGGGAADISELAAPVERGLFIPALALHGGWMIGRRGSALAEGARLIRGGAPGEPVANLTVLFEPFELLAQIQALSARQRTIPSPLQRSARTASATVAPAGRAGGGLFVAGPA
jgi:predicted Zn-dependent protease